MQNQIILEKIVEDDIIQDDKITQLINWVLSSQKEDYSWNINIIFVNDDFIIDLNKKYFHKNYATDVISFNLSDSKDAPEGEVYICVQTAIANAERFNSAPADEILRLVAHGIYHLLDYEDSTDEQKEKMTELENSALEYIYQKS